MTWTDTRIETLKLLWSEGLSGAQIAFQFNMDGIAFSRNAVIGKANRLGLESRKTLTWHPQQPDGLARPPRVERSKVTNPFGINGASKVTRERKNGKLPSLPADVADNPVTLLELEPHHCRFPIGDPDKPDFVFCGGDKMDGESYCARHCRIAYMPLQSRSRRYWNRGNPRAKAVAA